MDANISEQLKNAFDQQIHFSVADVVVASREHQSFFNKYQIQKVGELPATESCSLTSLVANTGLQFSINSQEADLQDDSSEWPTYIVGEPGAGVDSFFDDTDDPNDGVNHNAEFEAAVIYDSYKTDAFLLQDYFCFVEIYRINNLWLAANEGDDDVNFRYREIFRTG